MTQFHERFRRRHISEIEQHFMPEARVHQMEHCMLRSADIEIDRHPIPLFIQIAEYRVVLRVDVAEIIPAASSPLRHRVCFASPFFSALRIDNSDPVGSQSKRRFRRPARLEFLKIGQHQRQIPFIHASHRSVFPVNDRNRFTPVPLAGKEPVPQFVIDFLLSDSFGFEPCNDCTACFLILHAVDAHLSV